MLSPLVSWLLLAALGLLYFANLLQVRFSHELIPLFQVKLFLTSSQTRKNNVNLLGGAAKGLLKGTDLLIPVMLGLNLYVSLRFPVERTGAEILIAVVVLVSFLLILRAAGAKMPPYQRFEKFGLLSFYLNSSLESKRTLSQSDLDNISARTQPPQNTAQDPMFGVYRGKNVIFLQLESFQSFLVDFVIDGQEATPFLNKLVREGMHFTNTYPQYSVGHTSDCELTVLNSLYPLKNEIVNYRHYTKNFQALPKLLKPYGYKSTAYHNYSGDYYNRKIMFKTYGFEHYYAVEEYLFDHRIGLGLSDLTFLQQSVDKIKRQPKPFFCYMITLTSHFPFTIEESEQRLRIQADLDPTVQKYLQTVRHTDEALKQFFESLQQEGLLQDTVVVLYGDHEGVPPDHKAEVLEFLQIENNSFNSINFRKVPFLIYAGENCGQFPQKINHAGSTLDVLPTVLHLLGIERTGYQFGQNLLNPDETRAFALRPFWEGTYVSQKYLYSMPPQLDYSLGSLYDRQTGQPLALADHPDAYEIYEEILKTLHVSDSLIQNNLIPKLDETQKKSMDRDQVLPAEMLACFDQMAKNSIVLPFRLQIEKSLMIQIGNHGNYLSSVWDQFAQDYHLIPHFFFQLDLQENEKPVYFSDHEYLAIFRENGYTTEIVQGATLFDALDDLPANSLILISVKDDGSQAFHGALGDRLPTYGIHALSWHNLRASYMNILHKTEQGFVSLYEQLSDEALELNVKKGDSLQGLSLPFDLHMLSAGALCGNKSSIQLNGNELSRNQRGMNFVVYSLEQDKVLDKFDVDTFSTVQLNNSVYVARKKAPAPLAAPVKPVEGPSPDALALDRFLKDVPDYERDSLIVPFTNAEDKKRRAPSSEWEVFGQEHHAQPVLFHELDLAANRKPIYFADCKYFHPLRVNKHTIQVVVGETIFDYLNRLEPHHIVLISVKDDGSQAFLPEWLPQAETHGIQMRRDHLRHSYANILVKHEDRWESIREQITEERIEWLISQGETLGNFVSPADIALHSAGATGGNHSSIVINGQEYSPNKRGMNFVVFDPEKNEVVDSFNVDTFMTLQLDGTIFVATPA